MNEEAVSLWIRRAENDLKIGKGELATEDPATDAIRDAEAQRRANHRGAGD